MATKRPTTISAYIAAAPAHGQPHLHAIYRLLKSVVPQAQEAIKWGNPFFVEPRFLFAFSAYKAHLSFAPSGETMQAFAEELKAHATTANFLKVRYDQPLPEDLIRRMAEYRRDYVQQRQDDGFW